jgi:hypothetical protein
VTHSRGYLAIHDWRQLQAVAGFDPTYLHVHEGLPVEDAEGGG